MEMLRIRNVVVLMMLFILMGCGGSTPSDTSSTLTTTEVTTPLTTDLTGSLQKGIGVDGAYPFANSEDPDNPIWMSSADLLLNEHINTDSRYQSIEKFDGEAFVNLQNRLKESQYIVYWITSYWNESWFDLKGMQALLDKGYVLVFNYWYFADALDGGLPNDEQVQAYYEHNKKVVKYLSQLKGKKLIIMEPEFNKQSVVTNPSTQDQEAFADMLGGAIDTLRAGISDVAFSLSMMDTGVRDASVSYSACGYSPCSKGDLDMWKRSETIYKRLGDRLDFISFSEMLGQFSRDYKKPTKDDGTPNPRSYTNTELGIDDLPERLVNLVNYLQETYEKPVFLSHIALATATWEDANGDDVVQTDEVNASGWQPEVDTFYIELKKRSGDLLEGGLFGLASMKLFDNPQQDINGYQYFLQNEYHLGLVSTSAVDGVDTYLKGDIHFKGTVFEGLFNEI